MIKFKPKQAKSLIPADISNLVGRPVFKTIMDSHKEGFSLEPFIGQKIQWGGDQDNIERIIIAIEECDDMRLEVTYSRSRGSDYTIYINGDNIDCSLVFI